MWKWEIKWKMSLSGVECLWEVQWKTDIERQVASRPQKAVDA